MLAFSARARRKAHYFLYINSLLLITRWAGYVLAKAEAQKVLICLTMAKLGAVFITILLAACAAGPLYVTPPQAKEGYATLVLLRAPALGGSAWSHSFYVDKVLVAELRVHGYTHLMLRAGPHEVHYGGNPEYRGHLLPLNAVAGETYFFQEDLRTRGVVPIPMGVIMSYSDSVKFLSKETAEYQLVNYRYQTPVVEIIE